MLAGTLWPLEASRCMAVIGIELYLTGAGQSWLPV